MSKHSDAFMLKMHEVIAYGNGKYLVVKHYRWAQKRSEEMGRKLIV